MIAQIKQLVHDCLTGKDGESYDPARVAGALVLGVFLFLALWAVVAQGKPFDPQAFGIGAGAVLTGIGLGVKLKANTEPGQ